MTFKQDAREAKKLRVPRSTDFSNIYLNIDNNIKTCITGRNCQAGYATVSHCISEIFRIANFEIRFKCDFIIEMSFLLYISCISHASLCNCLIKVAPHSLVQFINYLYRSAISDVILTTFAWNFRGSGNILKQAAESCF